MESAHVQVGQITVNGSFNYRDRTDVLRPARFMRVLLYDADIAGGDDLLAQTTCGATLSTTTAQTRS